MNTKKTSKQVIVMRKDLKMRKGKMIAQGAHASMKVFFDQMKTVEIPYEDDEGSIDVIIKRLQFDKEGPEIDWIDGIFTKICVYVNSEEELLEIYEKARQEKIPCALIEDRGLTEFGGVQTKTCCAIGPDWAEVIDPITKHLPLL